MPIQVTLDMEQIELAKSVQLQLAADAIVFVAPRDSQFGTAKI